MWSNSNYSSILKMHLNKYNRLKLQINNNGFIASIEKQENGQWINDRNLPKILNKISNSFHLEKNMTIILEQ
ncbi:hypothetical protein G1K75_09680 [Tenacibaculum finnmarkense]|uniref:Uncharacterized protein n=1 Tax=Tenacibaculum finnmarkense genomovar finnmarkense TaxID=1458503 RepID=A0AAP1WGF0_9FLAO|nr:hypothetical protein [Tenacibaculum finnmarkense]MBE7653016.1 hypothetical protein [Tenacibaculum finnmarkense genomovar finnmarkense]MBE7693291.1 hypothetical protein [Tenacibaculum finnmarkense genomovar finnmarkense]MBE7695317.1 hypothetical protein [Tenacibaculum finnmarkense genomovar finnmarkense]MCD8403504.1 hypothetical protein [Tenacibaculum finnmarkense genomovar finnmarkense]MCD8427540.1 hypothetical protein [Tenacibaculum finnmarkense genomovar finnmarkense]